MRERNFGGESGSWVLRGAGGAVVAGGTPDDMGRNQGVIDADLGANHDSDRGDN